MSTWNRDEASFKLWKRQQQQQQWHINLTAPLNGYFVGLVVLKKRLHLHNKRYPRAVSRGSVWFARRSLRLPSNPRRQVAVLNKLVQFWRWGKNNKLLVGYNINLTNQSNHLSSNEGALISIRRATNLVSKAFVSGLAVGARWCISPLKGFPLSLSFCLNSLHVIERERSLT